MPKDHILRVAGYVRLSDENQSLFSVDFQKKKIQEWCAVQGGIMADERLFSDGKSAKYWRDRKGLQSLIAAAKRHEFDVLVMYRLDRFSRNRDHQIIIREQLQYYGIRIVTLDADEHSDDDSISGKIIREVYAIMAELELKKITERCQDGLRERYESGYLPVGGRPLYGYSWIDVTRTRENGKEEIIPKAAYILKKEIIVTDEDGVSWTEGKVVVYIFQLIDEGVPLRRVAILLSQKGIPSPQGNAIWRHQSCRDIARNRFYTGQVHANKRKFTYEMGVGTHRELRPEDEWIALPSSVIIPIVPLELFERVQQRLVTNLHDSPRNNANPEKTLLRCGLAFCGYCGAKAAIEYNKSRETYYYRCPTYSKGFNECVGMAVKNEYADKAAWEKAMTILRDPSLVAREITKNRRNDPTEDGIASAKQGIAKLAPAIQNLVETIAETPAGEGRRILSLRLEEVAGQRLAFQLEIDRLSRMHEQWSEAQAKIDAFAVWCYETRTHLDNPDYAPTYREKREALEYLGICAMLFKMDHDPYIQIEVSPPDIMSAFG